MRIVLREGLMRNDGRVVSASSSLPDTNGLSEGGDLESRPRLQMPLSRSTIRVSRRRSLMNILFIVRRRRSLLQGSQSTTPLPLR
jgi:hypothetical protein